LSIQTAASPREISAGSYYFCRYFMSAMPSFPALILPGWQRSLRGDWTAQLREAVAAASVHARACLNPGE
jgi:hypothetical protein